MNTKKNDTHFFFQGGMISTIKKPDKTYRAFRRDNLPLAEIDTLSGQALLATDMSGSALRAEHEQQGNTRAYSPYGHDANAVLESHLIGFNGEPLDLPTQSYLLGSGYRLFNPVLMRFYGPDTLSPFDDGGFNAYAYCAGDPVNNTDPSGHVRLPHIFRRLSPAAVTQNSHSRISSYEQRIEVAQKYAYDPLNEGRVLQSGISKRYKQSDSVIRSYKQHISKHEQRLIELGETPVRKEYPEYGLPYQFQKNRPTPKTPSLLPVNASQTPRNNKQRALDSQHLTAQEKYNHDKTAIIQIEGGRYYSKGRIEEERRAIRS